MYLPDETKNGVCLVYLGPFELAWLGCRKGMVGQAYTDDLNDLGFIWSLLLAGYPRLYSGFRAGGLVSR